VQGAKRLALRDDFIRRARLGHQPIFIHERNDRIHFGIHSLDLKQVSLHHFMGGQLFFADRCCKIRGSHEADLAVWIVASPGVGWNRRQVARRSQIAFHPRRQW